MDAPVLPLKEAAATATVPDYEPPTWGRRARQRPTETGAADPWLVCLEAPFDAEVVHAATRTSSSTPGGGRAAVAETFDVSPSAGHHVVGSWCSAAVVVEHPSVEPRHAVLQYAEDEENSGHSGGGPAELRLYACDLGSKHGTFVNDQRLPPREYHRLHWGDVLRFGQCSRPFVLAQRRGVVSTAESGSGNGSDISGQANGSRASPLHHTPGTAMRDTVRTTEPTDHRREQVDEDDHPLASKYGKSNIPATNGEEEAQDDEDSNMCDHLTQDEDVDGERPHLICVDVGTTGVRAYAYDVSPLRSSEHSTAKRKLKRGESPPMNGCRNRGGVYRRIPTICPHPGWIEQDPEVKNSLLVRLSFMAHRSPLCRLSGRKQRK